MRKEYLVMAVFIMAGVAHSYDFTFTCADPYFVCGSMNGTCSDPVYGIYLVNGVFQATQAGTYGVDMKGYANSACAGINITASGVEINQTCAFPDWCRGATYPTNIWDNGNTNIKMFGVDRGVLLIGVNSGTYNTGSAKAYYSNGVHFTGYSGDSMSTDIINSTNMEISDATYTAGGGHGHINVEGGSDFTMTNVQTYANWGSNWITITDVERPLLTNNTGSSSYPSCQSGQCAITLTRTTDAVIENGSTTLSINVVNGSNFISRADIATLNVQGLNLGSFRNVGTGTFTDSSAVQINMIDTTSSSVSITFVNSSDMSIVGNRSFGALSATNTPNVYVNALNCINDSNCGSTINTITLVNSSNAIINNVYNSTLISLTGSSNGQFGYVSPTAIEILSGSDGNTFSNPNYTWNDNHRLKTLTITNSANNLVEKFRFEPDRFAPNGWQYGRNNFMTISGAAATGNIIRQNYYQKSYCVDTPNGYWGCVCGRQGDTFDAYNCVNGLTGMPWLFSIEGGATGNNILENLIMSRDTDYRLFSDSISGGNTFAKNGIPSISNGTRNISGSVASPIWAGYYYGGTGSEYPLNETFKSDDGSSSTTEVMRNATDYFPMTADYEANASTGDLNVTIVSPLAGGTVSTLTFNATYSITGGTNTRNCYRALTQFGIGYWQYQTSIPCNGTTVNNTVSTWGTYDMIIGAYSDEGASYKEIAFFVNNGSNGTAPPQAGGGGGGSADPNFNCLAYGVGCTTNNTNITTCIPFITCETSPPDEYKCTAGVDCEWDVYCKANPTSEGCKIVTNPFLKGTLPWIATLSKGLRDFVFNALVTLQKLWWILVAILMGYSAKDVIKGKETLSGVIAFAGAVTIALIFI